MQRVVLLSLFVLIWGDHDGRWKKYNEYRTQQDCFAAGLAVVAAGFKVYRCKHVR